MSLLINGMVMPDSCSKCPLKYSSYDMYCCRMIHGDGCIVCVDSYTERRNPACPLIEIPTPHGRLIDADELMKVIEANDYTLQSYYNTTDRGMFTIGIKQAIDEVPTIIETEE